MLLVKVAIHSVHRLLPRHLVKSRVTDRRRLGKWATVRDKPRICFWMKESLERIFTSTRAGFKRGDIQIRSRRRTATERGAIGRRVVERSS